MTKTLPAKLTPPRLGKTLKRQRLFEKLDDHGLTWICSPPGSGKSILAASYLAIRQYPVFWYRVDESDEDIASLFYYLELAANTINSDVKESFPSFSPEFLERIEVFSRLFFRHLFERLHENGVLVFDCLHMIPADSQLHQVLSAGLSEIPHGMQAMLLSRTLPPKPWSPLLVNKQMVVMDWPDIQLTKEETLEIVNQHSDKEFTNETLKQIYDFTQGWAAGLALILAQSDDIDFKDTPSNISNEGIFDFFSTVFWDTLEKDEQCILLTGALLPSISSDGLTKISGKTNSIDVLTRLHRHHCFTVQLENGEYQYHPLFFLFLLNRLEHCYNPEQLRSVRQKAAEYLIRKDQVEPAAKLLQEASAWPELVQLICTQAPFLLEHGRQKILSNWLSEIPGEIFKQQPWLYYWQGQIMLTQDMAAARQNCITAFEKIQTTDTDRPYRPVSHLLGNY